MAAQVKPVKVLTDLVTKKQIIKKDGTTDLFRVSGSISSGVVTGHVSSSLPLTASSVYTPELVISSSTVFQVTELQNLVTDDRYNVDAAIHEIDKAIKKTGITDAVRAKEAENAYKRLRFIQTGSFDADGYAEIALPLTMSHYDYPTLVGGPVNGLYEPPVFENGAGTIDAGGESSDPDFDSFPVSSLDFINLDVMVKDCEDPTAIGLWVNDIIAVNLTQSSSNPGVEPERLWVKLYAPEYAGSTGTKYRLIAINEDPDKYIIR